MRTTDSVLQSLVKLLLCAGLLWSWQTAQAQVSSSMKGKAFSIDSSKDDDTWVEIEFPASELVPYKERRPANQLSFGFQYEPTTFTNFASPIDSAKYEALFGKSSVDILQIAAGWKVNLPLLGIDLQGMYGRGVMSDTRSGQATSLALNKKGLKVLAVLDGIFNENYAVPYFGIQYLEWDVTTANDLASVSLTTGPVMAMTAGIYLSVHWLEKNSALMSYNEGGLNNTYIDLFINQYQQPRNAADPDLSGTAFGAGFKLEF